MAAADGESSAVGRAAILRQADRPLFGQACPTPFRTGQRPPGWGDQAERERVGSAPRPRAFWAAGAPGGVTAVEEWTGFWPPWTDVAADAADLTGLYALPHLNAEHSGRANSWSIRFCSMVTSDPTTGGIGVHDVREPHGSPTTKPRPSGRLTTKT